MKSENLIEKFKKYFNNFDISDVAIERKYYHSLRVMDIATLIAKSEKFDVSDIELSGIVGLLHDYARFIQWTKYKTYNDLESIDHGDLAVNLLFDNGEIRQFDINEDYYDEIYDAIKYHNKICLPDNLSKHNELLCKLIRDADKLDIFYLFGTEKSLFEEDNLLISDKIKEDFFSFKQIDRRDVKSNNDKIILDLAMIFDLNFKYSFYYLNKNKLLDKIYENINNKEIFKEYFDFINHFINEKKFYNK